MKAAFTNEQHGFDIVEVPDPAPGPGELVIRVAACGVCGSDIKGPDRGGFAELTVVPARHSFAIPNGLPSTHAALVEPPSPMMRSIRLP